MVTPRFLRVRISSQTRWKISSARGWRISDRMRRAMTRGRRPPTLATSIGNSSDRPAALAELMGIILNDGVKKPTLRITQLHWGRDTPYETIMTPTPVQGERVMAPALARALRAGLADVVEHGTARRLAGSFLKPDGTPVIAGGKTGSGDNRFKTFNRYGGLTSSRAVNRTATFVFYLGDRYFGVLTSFVPDEEAEGYSFTSALPVSILKLLAPAINPRLQESSESTSAWRWAQDQPAYSGTGFSPARSDLIARSSTVTRGEASPVLARRTE